MLIQEFNIATQKKWLKTMPRHRIAQELRSCKCPTALEFKLKILNKNRQIKNPEVFFQEIFMYFLNKREFDFANKLVNFINLDSKNCLNIFKTILKKTQAQNSDREVKGAEEYRHAIYQLSFNLFQKANLPIKQVIAILKRFSRLHPTKHAYWDYRSGKALHKPQISPSVYKPEVLEKLFKIENPKKNNSAQDAEANLLVSLSNKEQNNSLIDRSKQSLQKLVQVIRTSAI